MGTRALLVAIAVALAIAPTAAGGGWATVGFAPLPDGTDAGSTWSQSIYVKQHGVTPMTGLQPIVSVHRDDTGAMQTFMASETSEPGVYTADVVFPTAGDWRVTVDSGFAGSNVTYGPVEIGGPGVAGGGGPDLPAVGFVVALALLGGLALVAARRRGLTPAS
jgi:YtkA-like